MIANLMQDVRYSLRQLRKTPGFTMTAVLTLALGIGANTAIFTLVQAVLLKNLPVVDPSSLVRLGDREDCCNLSLASFDSDYTNFSTEGYEYLRDHTPEFAELAAMQAGRADLSVRRAGSAAPPRSSFGEFVSGNYFQTFGIQPLQGRMLLPSDDNAGAAPVAVISYQIWQRDFGGEVFVGPDGVDLVIRAGRGNEGRRHVARDRWGHAIVGKGRGPGIDDAGKVRARGDACQRIAGRTVLLVEITVKHSCR
jgi:hypothetical protein